MNTTTDFFTNVTDEVLGQPTPPLSLNTMTKEEFDAEIQKAVDSIEAGHFFTEEEVDTILAAPPFSLGVMTKEEIDAALQEGWDDIQAGRLVTEEELDAELARDYGVPIP